MALPQSALGANLVLGSGAAVPFQFAPTGGVQAVAVDSGPQKVNDSIHMILATKRGERVMRPTFGCLAGDTLVSLLDGREVPIKDLVGQSTWLYGCTRGGVIVPAYSPGAVCQGRRQVVEVLLDNGERIRCTPNHPFLCKDGVYRPAASLRGIALLGRTASNHRVVSVLQLGEEDVFDLVDSTSANYAVSAGVWVHNSNLYKLLFQPNDPILSQAIEFEVTAALTAWEKRIQVDSVQALSAADLGGGTQQLPGAQQPAALQPGDLQSGNAVGVMVNYTILQTSQPMSYVYDQRQAGPATTAPVDANLDLLGPLG
jgi:phage baseplate assembly protein W